MYVITLGPGNVDLSIPATMTFAGAVSMKIIDSNNAMILPGLAIAIGCGVAVGIFNYGLIRALRIPPIIATLSSSFLVQSAAIAYGRGIKIKPPPMLADFTTWRIADIPVLAICVMALAAVMSLVLHRTVFGRSVTAIGQNQRAAELAGSASQFHPFCNLRAVGGSRRTLRLPSFRVLRRRLTQHGCGISVGVDCGCCYRRYVGRRRFLQRVRSLGRCDVHVLLVTMLNTFGLSAGFRLILTGLIIVCVITLAGGRRRI